MPQGCPHSRDPRSGRAGTGGPADGSSFVNLATGQTERRFNGGNIQDELVDRTSNSLGTLSMANTGDPHTGGSQFFLNVASNPNLDWFSPGESRHPVFGKLADSRSLELCVKISRVATRNDNPLKPIQVRSVTVDMGSSEGGGGAGAGGGDAAGAAGAAGGAGGGGAGQPPPAAGSGSSSGGGGSGSGGAAAAAPSATYFYLDHSQKEQGPFTLDQMRGWFRAGHMAATTRVRKDGVAEFTALEGDADIVQQQGAGAAPGRPGGLGSARYAPY